MHEYARKCIARKFTPFSQGSPVSGVLPSENGERGRNLLRGREALPAQPENPLSARSGRGDVQMAQRMKVTYELKE